MCVWLCAAEPLVRAGCFGHTTPNLQLAKGIQHGLKINALQSLAGWIKIIVKTLEKVFPFLQCFLRAWSPICSRWDGADP